jgi:lipopolysaccharide/colanic/teichoic acid biosynthesis glycosyltransferase
MMAIERKRTERTQEPFLLMLLEGSHHHSSEKNGKPLESVASCLVSSIRETDVIGWYNERTAVGVMYTGLVVTSRNSILSTILTRVSATLQNELTLVQFNEVSISFHFFPDTWDQNSSGRPSNPALYPDLLSAGKERRSSLGVKRMMDIAGSTLMLMLSAPLFILIALAVKASSKGPVLFKQQRVGQYGRHFTFLKFRTMQIDNDHGVHKEFITEFIANRAGDHQLNGRGDGVYKLTKDKRVTRIGKLLRRSSLDELPQFLNVLNGDMSLVGPRPPIPYELAVYQTWHRRRVLEVKPGITGLWQVTGRSRVKFDEMVRLDLRYASTWTPWLDFKILMRTPLAVIRGVGAV